MLDSKFTVKYLDADEQHVGSVLLYGNATFLYADKSHKVKVTYEELEKLFAAVRIMIVDGTTAYSVAGIHKSGSALEVFCSDEAGSGSKKYKTADKAAAK